MTAEMKERIKLIDGWKFKFDLDNSLFDLNDSDWQNIVIPHTWNNYDGQDGGNNYLRGKGWYKYNFYTEINTDRDYFLEFYGVNAVCTIFVNGRKAGIHDGGYTLFRFNITDFIQNGENEILVSADNSPFPDVVPLTADFTFFGGIYREVYIIAVPKTHFSLDDFGSDGVYLSYANDESIANQVHLNVKALICGDCSDCSLRIRVSIPDSFEHCITASPDFSIQNIISPDGKMVAEKEITVSSHIVESVIDIANPHLWNGRTDPFRYKAECILLKNGIEVDRVDKYIGFRYFKIYPLKGFYLNGKSYPLRGVNRHQDRKNMGWAITCKEHNEDFELIYEIGANAIRLAHYPHHPYFYDLCDKYGILVWAEVPFVENIGGLKLSGLPTDINIDSNITEKQLKNIKNQLSELILQQCHRPSIFCWSMSNEVREIYGKTADYFMKELNTHIHSLDSSRVSVLATNHAKGLKWDSDYKGVNIYPGWYYGSEKDFSSQAAYYILHNRLKGIAISEYGAGANIAQHSESPKKPKNTICDFHCEEWASIVHENALKFFMSPLTKIIWGSFVWNMFDFAIDSRNEGSMPGMNNKGLVTYDRKIKKDAFYIYKAYWSKKPFVYITSRRFEQRQKNLITVKIYSNESRVTLYLNGKRVKTLSDYQNKQKHIYLFKKIQLENGENTVSVKGNYSEDRAT